MFRLFFVLCFGLIWSSAQAQETAPPTTPSTNADYTAVYEEKLRQLLAQPYDANVPYTAEEIQPKIREAEELKLLLPNQAAEIEKFLVPWKETQSALAAGKSQHEGEWKTKEEIEKNRQERERREREAWLQIHFQPSLTATLVPRPVVWRAGLCLLITILFLLEGFWLSRKRRREGDIGAARFYLFSSFATLFVFTLYFGAMTQPPPDLNETSTPATSAQLEVMERLLRRAREPGYDLLHDGERQVEVTPSAINDVLQKYLKKSASPPLQPWEVERLRLSVKVGSESFQIFEEGVWHGWPVIISYEIHHQQTKDGLLLEGCDVRMGRAPLPGFFARWIWNPVRPQLEKIITDTKILEIYQTRKIKEGSILLLFSTAPPGAAGMIAP